MIKKHAKVIGIAACLLVACLANAQVEYAWKVIATHPSAQSITAYQGETIALKPALYSYNNLVTNITSATLYWQTNGMETAWWSKPAEINDGQITATFAPTNDFGAAAYTFFIRASSGSGASYRANGTLRMLDSPGHSPAVAVDPAAYGTLAQDIAPWVLAVLPDYEAAGAALAVSNTLAAAISGNTANISALAGSHVLLQSLVATNTAAIDALKSVAITNEKDPRAMRLYHYGDTDIVESPADWFVFDGAGTITGYNYVAGREDVVIPWEIGGVPVTSIGNSAFIDPMASGHPIKTVIAPKTVTSIEDSAFEACFSLTTIDFPAVTSIGNSAFLVCYALASVDFPAVTSIEDSAFEACSSLTTIDFPAVTSIGNSAFEACDSLTTIDFPAVTSIGNSAFLVCYALASVDFPAVTSIGNSAFYSCYSLTSITTAANAPTVGTDAFSVTHANAVITVTDPQATGWGATLSDGSTSVPVVRPTAYAVDFVKSGVPVATAADIAAIPRVPTNATTGWLMFDAGSNLWGNVIFTNLNFEVWEVTK